MPFLGLHSIRGDEGESFDVGLRVGMLLGGYAFERFSFNGEIALDWANPDEPLGTDIIQFMGDLAFSPLFHAPLGPVELIVGPKLGLFYLYNHADLPFLGSVTTTANGWTYGLNLGVMIPLSRAVSGGLLLAYQIRNPSEVCLSMNDDEVCGDGDSAGILAVNAALLF